MDPERWKRLRAIFEAAIEQDPAHRTAYIEKACSDDPALQREVEVLLANYNSFGDSFLEKPAYQTVPELFTDAPGKSLVGKSLGPYIVNSKLGEGGMGIVYLARDTRLDRPVAIKMLAPEFTQNTQYRERLRREARAAARLSHPGIATVYALEEFDESLYMVSEYVPGNTLLQMRTEGPLSPALLLDIAVQIAHALTTAHEQGIVHRDLKPENIVRTAQGNIKILDFGLARFQDFSGHVSGSAKHLTQAGVFLGTPAYASPEQLLGLDVDFRSDIFSFGVVLYELAAGNHPFAALDPISQISRILEGKANDLIQVNESIPREFSRIVSVCMRKKPEDRYSKTRQLQNELERLQADSSDALKSSSSTTGVGQPKGNTPSALWWWQFHQAVAGFGYYGMIYPMWRVKKWVGGIEGSLLFFPFLIAVGVAANLRLHLWFTSRFYPSQLAHQRQKAARWIRWADCLLVLMLAISAAWIHTAHAIIATLLMAVAIGSLVAFSMIEPTTTNEALGKKQ